jgi:hypothetical protein
MKKELVQLNRDISIVSTIVFCLAATNLQRSSCLFMDYK